ncbi:hypothetical protein ACN28I_26565 [Archangium gephyra]|uniref:hypothetical protein n=1 Tax=Archangium gephyra TaxID=48 RepID=UPI003B77E24D
MRKRNHSAVFIGLVMSFVSGWVGLSGCTSQQDEPVSGSPGSPAAQAPSGESSSLKELDGERIYAGLFLGIGPASGLLPELYGPGSPYLAVFNNPRKLIPTLTDTANRLEQRGDDEGARILRRTIAQVEKGERQEGQEVGVDELRAPPAVADLLISQVKQQHPGFFDEFEESVRSGEPSRVRRALQRAAEVSYEANKTVLAGQSSTLSAEQGLVVDLIWMLVLPFPPVLWVQSPEAAAAGAETSVRGLMKEDALGFDELVARVTQAFR